MPSSVGKFLGRQVGPLPVGAWLAVVAGGLGLGYLATRSGGGGEEPVEEAPIDTATGDYAAIDEYGGVPAYQPGPYVPPPYSYPTDPYVPPEPVPSSQPPITINLPPPEQPAPVPALDVPAPPPAPAPTRTQPAPGKTYLPNKIFSYTTRKGDTLTKIASTPGIRGTFPGGAGGLYSANKSTIDAAARKAGIKAVGVNTALPAGIVLRIP